MKNVKAKFAVISEVSQLCLAPKLHSVASNLAIAVFLLHSACLLPLAFAPLVLQGVDCGLLALDSTSSSFFFLAPLCLAVCLHFAFAVMSWLCSANPWYATLKPVLGMIILCKCTQVVQTGPFNCIPKCDKLHS